MKTSIVMEVGRLTKTLRGASRVGRRTLLSMPGERASHCYALFQALRFVISCLANMLQSCTQRQTCVWYSETTFFSWRYINNSKSIELYSYSTTKYRTLELYIANDLVQRMFWSTPGSGNLFLLSGAVVLSTGGETLCFLRAANCSY